MMEDRASMLLVAVQLAYRKHWLDDPNIGWEELGNFLYNTLAEEMGDQEFIAWLERAKLDIESGGTVSIH